MGGYLDAIYVDGKRFRRVAGRRRLAPERARGEYRTCRYDDPNRFDGGARLLRREEDRYIASLRADRRLTGPWRLFLDYHYTRNDSNFRVYDYSRHQLMAGVETAL